MGTVDKKAINVLLVQIFSATVFSEENIFFQNSSLPYCYKIFGGVFRTSATIYESQKQQNCKQIKNYFLFDFMDRLELIWF